MSRMKNLTRAMASGYAAMGANVLYTMGSVPLALTYLSKSEFGLWALVMQIGGYLSLIDLGMSSSLGRFLIDHKDTPSDGLYGGTIKTGLLVQAVQGLGVLLVGLILAWLLPGWLRVPSALSGAFFWLMCGQSLLTATGFPTRIFGQMLNAHQRIDMQNYGLVGSFLLSFVALWLGFAGGLGIYSLLLAGVVGSFVLTAITALACWRFGLLPRAGEWGRVTWARFRELFHYGANVFLIAVGTQLIISSQTVLISRTLGIDTAAVWSVMTKAFSLVCQLVWRAIGNAIPAFAEMQVRGENEHLRRRYRGFFIVVNVVAGLVAVLFAACNGPFIAVWTLGRMQWPVANDWLLAVWMILLTQVCCHNSLIICLKQVGRLKYVYFAEGCAFLLAALAVMPRWGIPGMLVCSIVTTATFTLSYGTFRMIRLLGIDWRQALLEWQMPLVRLLAALLPIAAVLAYALAGHEPLVKLAVILPSLGIVAFFVGLRLCVPKPLLVELSNRLPMPVGRWLQALAMTHRFS
jgi:O-antigen/teichoic acid export membrane protein